MVAHALGLAGLFLGREVDLYTVGTADNPGGYWENARIVALNDEILARLGGGWENPPSVPDRWKGDTRIADLRGETKRLVGEFRDHDPWGWKDPRTCLTFSLWAELVPDLKTVVCLRNPLEVALSLHRRFVSYSTGLELWETYNRRIIEATAPEQRIVVDYEAWLSRPGPQIRRLLEFVGIPVDKSVVEQARAATDGELRRNRFTSRDLLDSEVAPEIVELYAWLRREAGRAPSSRGRPAPKLPRRALRIRKEGWRSA